MPPDGRERGGEPGRGASRIAVVYVALAQRSKADQREFTGDADHRAVVRALLRLSPLASP